MVLLTSNILRHSHAETGKFDKNVIRQVNILIKKIFTFSKL